MNTLITQELPEDIRRMLSASAIVYCEIGARRGGRRFTGIGEFVHYYGFEPDAKEAEKLRNTLAAQKVFQSVRILPYAVMEKSGRVSVNVLKHRGCSSVLLPNADVVSQYRTRRGNTDRWPRFFDVVGRYECEAISLDEFAAKEHVASIDFVGLDTQGTEYAILTGGNGIISRTTLLVHVEMETVPLYQDQPLIADIVRLLADLGFRLIKLENPQYISRQPADADDAIDQGELISVDGVFCRDPNEQFFKGLGGNPATIAKYMLILDALGFKTLAMDVGRRFQTTRGGDGRIRELGAMLERRYRSDNFRAKPLRGKARSMAKQLLAGLRFKRDA